MADQAYIMEAVAEASLAWQDPEHPARQKAVAKSLAAPNRFTEEALAFAINQQMHLLTPEAQTEWLGGRWATTPRIVGVLSAGNVPLADLQDFLAVVLMGHRYYGVVSSKSPHLLRAFAEEVRRHVPALPASFGTVEQMFAEANAVIATGNDETRAWAEAESEAHGIPSERRLLRGHRYAAAILDGQETEDERENLAEDVLLHEGLGCRNVALIWAPRGLSPDPYFEALAHFRSVFPAHPETPGALKMQQAFLEAVDLPHAYGEGMEFLVSRGEPEAKGPGHIRWSEYDDMAVALAWLHAHRDELQLIAVRSALAERLPTDLPVEPLGFAQRPALAWRPDGRDTLAFLEGL